MDDFWKNALKATGPVAVVGFILWSVLSTVFEQPILNLFSSMQVFSLVMFVICALIVVLVFSILAHGKKKPSNNDSPRTTNVVLKESTIKQDFVAGDKHVHKDSD
ncbi:MAG: hypothetical protein AB2687_22735 [Candidatus Thiodiazotropha taylori]